MKDNKRVVPKKNYLYLLIMIVMVVIVTFVIVDPNLTVLHKKSPQY